MELTIEALFEEEESTLHFERSNDGKAWEVFQRRTVDFGKADTHLGWCTDETYRAFTGVRDSGPLDADTITEE